MLHAMVSMVSKGKKVGERDEKYLPWKEAGVARVTGKIDGINEQ